MLKNQISSILNRALYLGGIFILRSFKWSTYGMSSLLRFSPVHMLLPLIGITQSYTTTLITSITYSCFTLLYTLHPAAIWIDALHLPTLCGALYFTVMQSNQKLHRILYALIPATCIALFVLHPATAASSWYAFFWCMPLVTLALPKAHFFVHALGSTFTTHAVGTILWIFTKPLPNWTVLAPIALQERLALACGMTVCFVGYHYLKQIIIHLTSTTLHSTSLTTQR